MRRLMVRGLVGLMCVCAPASASAQWYYGGGDFLSCTTSYGATTLSTAVTVVGIIYLMSGNVRAELMREYLRENDAAVQVALRTGQGEATRDLAQLFGVSSRHEARFGAMLRTQRAALTAQTGGDVTLAQADAFVEQVLAGMEADEALSSDVARWRQVATR